MTATITITNPILSGMNPDPSWIWDDEFQRIVLVTSSHLRFRGYDEPEACVECGRC